ncbi:MAG: hypothetical protein U0271_46945 [Polyangiaceae bacterium]
MDESTLEREVEHPSPRRSARQTTLHETSRLLGVGFFGALGEIVDAKAQIRARPRAGIASHRIADFELSIWTSDGSADGEPNHAGAGLTPRVPSDGGEDLDEGAGAGPTSAVDEAPEDDEGGWDGWDDRHG